MPGPTTFTPRLPSAVKRRLELTAASAWEALVVTHVTHAIQLIPLMGGHLSYEEVIERYNTEMGVTGSMAAAVRNRILVRLEGVTDEELRMPGGPASEAAREEPPDGSAVGRVRVILRRLRNRVRRSQEVEEVLALAFARAEEGAMRTHEGYAVSFAELLEGHLPMERAVRAYVEAVALTGCRAQAVAQRAMARLAELRIPDPDRDGIPGYVPGGGSERDRGPSPDR